VGEPHLGRRRTQAVKSTYPANHLHDHRTRSSTGPGARPNPSRSWPVGPLAPPFDGPLRPSTAGKRGRPSRGRTAPPSRLVQHSRSEGPVAPRLSPSGLCRSTTRPRSVSDGRRGR
jgi:hypothetical protein